MTPLQLAQMECANHEHGGGCLGAHLGDKGQITHCNPKPRCVLSAGKRCAYFEECVAPMAGMVTEPRRAKAMQEAVHSYRMAHAGCVVVTRRARKGGQRGNLTSQESRQGPCLPRQQRVSEILYEDSGCVENGPSSFEVAATATWGAGT